MKRLFDLFISIVLLIVLLPVFFAVAILIKIDDKGPVFFKQKRGGKNQKHFYIIKFRTMVMNAEKMGMKFKTEENDPRITRLGNFLRKYSIDELPQIINVIKGDMSIVGPRPALTVQTDHYTEYQLKRLSVKPGITGLAQVNGRNNLSWDEKIELDVKYVENKSMFMDLKILLKTIGVVIKKGNIYNKRVS